MKVIAMTARGRRCRFQASASCILLGLLIIAPVGARSENDDVIAAEVPRTEEYVPVPVAGPFEFPWSIGFLPDGGILVTEKPGRLRVVRPGQPISQVGGVPKVVSGSHAGLLDVAVAPDFVRTATLYLSYTHGTEEALTIRVLKARYDRTRNILVDKKVIFESDPPMPGIDQLGGRLALSGDGHLFLTLGDRWQPSMAQDLTNHTGTIIRIRTDGSVPEGNPFVSVPGAKPEIWSYGHRNPQGLVVDAVTGRIWSTEHGPQGGDEVNLIEPGRNYGWPVITYGIDYSGEPIGNGTHTPGMEQPLHYWVPSIAPSGLALKREGESVSLWSGALVGQMVARLQLGQDRILSEERHLNGELGRIRDVREGPDGSLHVITDDPEGNLYKLVPATESAGTMDSRKPL
ncbi:PQQ-dependent sugar dehydrogenase [Microvirga makkahensis]|uniref:PQQ-dependent sugar dehydrogenase n=1 Tax=Microvirga makkahensis TaxID=1128670 RepID=A0A7X3MU61_9HYPH|nr:PQQ-dependent sugar dehydrogenase [Microvirga makkahensis]MXQ13269.1 PQQ-dependent sugar dehydrogenase [Microvirga makkahensis]